MSRADRDKWKTSGDKCRIAQGVLADKEDKCKIMCTQSTQSVLGDKGGKWNCLMWPKQAQWQERKPIDKAEKIMRPGHATLSKE